MDSRTINLARESFSPLAGRAAELADRFFANLFARQPAVRPLFPADVADLKKQIPSAVKSLLANAEKLETIESTLRELGKTYAKTGALEVHYATVSRTFVDTMREMSGAAWQARYTRAWNGIFAAVTKTMLRAAAGKPSTTMTATAPAATTTNTPKPTTGKSKRAA